MDWSKCPAVVTRPGYLSGCPGLRNDPRISPQTIVDNLDAGESALDVISNFGLRTPLADLLAIYEYARERRGPRAA